MNLFERIKKFISVKILFRKWYMPKVKNSGVFLTQHERREDINRITKIESKKESITPFNELIPLEKKELKNRFLSSHTYKNSDKYVYEITEAYLAGPYGLVCTDDKKLIRDTISFNGTGRVEAFLLSSYLKDPAWFRNFFLQSKDSIPKTAIDVEAGISFWSVWINYFHWIIEELPKLRALETYYEEKGVKPKIVIPSKNASYIHDSLICMGYDIQIDTMVYQGNTLRMKKLIVQTFPEITPELTSYVRKRVLHNLKLDTEATGNRRIYLSRDRTGNRNVTNKEEIMGLLVEYDFEEIHLEDLKFEEQVKLIHSASVVVSCHGAGLTNVLWGNNLKVIELFGHTIKTTYARLCEARGHQYKVVAGKPLQNNHRSNFYVDPVVVENQFKELGLCKIKTIE